MNYYITHLRENMFNAGFKAPEDINTICRALGWKEIPVPLGQKGKGLQDKAAEISANMLVWLKLLKAARKGEYILYQYPMYTGTKIARPFLKALNWRGIKTIVLIHDIEQLRSDQRSSDKEAEECSFFGSFTFVICHNPSMKRYLVDHGIPAGKIICLHIFDYLIQKKEENSSRDPMSDDLKSSSSKLRLDTVAIAGNLDRKKCSYIYEFAKENPGIQVMLYGANYVDAGLLNVQFLGKHDPGYLPLILDGDYGLVWDGDSTGACSGPMGEYLRYNNPHKMSLYLAAGIPVIVWSQSAAAEFVLRNKCGICVSSLKDLELELENITDDDYAAMKRASIKIGTRLRKGAYLKAALRRCGAL